MQTENSKYLTGALRVVDLVRLPVGSTCVYRVKDCEAQTANGRQRAWNAVQATAAHAKGKLRGRTYYAMDVHSPTATVVFLEITVTEQAPPRLAPGRQPMARKKK